MLRLFSAGRIVFQLDVKARLNVLDEPGFQEKSIDFAFGIQVIDVRDERHEVGGARIANSGLGER